MQVADRSSKSRAAYEPWLLLAVALGTMLAPLNSTMIAVALPDLSREFGVGIGQSGWLIVGYLIAMAVAQPIAGTLGDAYGRRRLFLGALSGFLIVSLAALVTPSFTILVILRLGQALCGGLAIPNAMAMVRELIPDDRRGRAYGLVASAAGMAAGFGPPLGGVLVGLGGWRATFAVNVPVIVVALVVGWIVLAPDKGHREARGRFDYVGALTLSGWLCALALIPSSLGRSSSWSLTAALTLATIVLLGAFVRWEMRAAQPIVRLQLFRNPSFAASGAAIALGNLAMYSTLVTLPQFLNLVQKRPSAEIGAILAALSIPLALLAPFGGSLADRWGRRSVALLGSALTLAGFATFLWLKSDSTIWFLVAPLVVAGCGLAMQWPAIQAAAIEAAPLRDAGMASGVFSTNRYVGSIIGSAALAALLGASAGPSNNGLLAVFVMVVVASLGALVASAFLVTPSPLPAGQLLDPG